MHLLRRFCFLISLLLLAASAPAAELTVYAAASLADALKELAPLYAKTSGDTLRFNLGASGTLARQIKEGAPADVFFSADEARMDALATAGLLLPDSRHRLLANSLVLVVSAEHPAAITSLAGLTGPSIHRLALGDPATVPAGTYAKTHLTQLNLWAPLQTKVVLLDNVRAVLATVESGDADAGIVYKTDALSSKRVKIAVEIPVADGPSITYPVAIVRETKSPEAASHLLVWLAGSEAQAVFARHGFLPATR